MNKAELPIEGIFFALKFLPYEVLLIKKLEIEKLSPLLLYVSVLKVEYWGRKYLVFASSRSVKMREFSFLSLNTFLGKCVCFSISER